MKSGTGFGHNYDEFEKLLPYELRLAKKIKNKPGTWDSREFEIIEKTTGKIIYAGVHDYPKSPAFCQFRCEQDKRWYALVSESYTSLSLIDLETGTKLDEAQGDMSPGNWCPLSIHVPAYLPMKWFLRTSEDGVTIKESLRWHTTADNKYTISDQEEFRGDYNRPPTIDDFVFADFAIVGAVFWGADNQTDVWMIPLTTIHKKKIGNRYHYLYATILGMPHVRDSFSVYWYKYTESNDLPEFNARFTVLKEDTIDISIKEIVHLGGPLPVEDTFVDHARDLITREHIYFNYGKNGRDIVKKKSFEDHE